MALILRNVENSIAFTYQSGRASFAGIWVSLAECSCCPGDISVMKHHKGQVPVRDEHSLVCIRLSAYNDMQLISCFVLTELRIILADKRLPGQKLHNRHILENRNPRELSGTGRRTMKPRRVLSHIFTTAAGKSIGSKQHNRGLCTLLGSVDTE